VNYSKGITWFDDCRIPFVDADSNINFDRPRTRKSVNDEWVLKQAHDYTNPDYKEYNNQGRFPANLLCSDDVLNDGLKTNKGHHPKSKVTGYGEFGNGKNEYFGKGEYSSVDSKSRYYDIDAWFNNLINNI
jgi:hypothetical protein